MHVTEMLSRQHTLLCCVCCTAKQGHSVFAHVHGFTPYLYVPAPVGFEARHCDALRQGLCEAVRARGRGEEKNLKHPCLGVTILRDKVNRTHMYWKVCT
jgi:DNA polymerase family B, exonuclease domain